MPNPISNPTDPAAATGLPEKSGETYDDPETALIRFRSAMAVIIQYQRELLETPSELEEDLTVVLRIPSNSFDGWDFTIKLLESEFERLYEACLTSLEPNKGAKS